MKLPYRNRAFIPPEKINDYLLSLTNPVGKLKSVFFRGIGFDDASTDKLEQQLYKIAQKNNVNYSRPSTNNSGINYEIIGELSAPNGKIYSIRTVWFIKSDKKNPSFVTAYPV